MWAYRREQVKLKQLKQASENQGQLIVEPYPYQFHHKMIYIELIIIFNVMTQK